MPIPSPSGDPNPQENARPTRRALAEAVRAACLRAAREAYVEAGMSGLCHEGAWEVALGAIETLDLEPLLRRDEG